MDKVRGELPVMQYRKLVLESNLVGYQDEVSTPKATVASLELEKVGLVDKIVISEHGVQKRWRKYSLLYFVLITSLKMMNAEHNLGLIDTDIPLYAPTRLQKMEEAFSALFCFDYLFEFGFPLANIDQLCTLVGPPNSGASTSSGGGVGASGS
ncbi:unnamed protein product [Lactuca saligna]|uniref:Uncharacterized protein n=1 Tax=Lactuca saligna TaxID=75948 RepID=A0AA35YR51_LACSI|nr:unnamed protein product [Lactuca saligna]